MATLPACEQREVASSSLIIAADGNMVMRSQSALHLLYVITSYSIHYTKLYECKMKERVASIKARRR